jgi:hypothetical protein
MPTKNKFCLGILFLPGTYSRYIYIGLKDNWSLRSHKTIEIKAFLLFFIFLLVDGRIRIRTNNYGSEHPDIQKLTGPDHWKNLYFFCVVKFQNKFLTVTNDSVTEIWD